MFYIIRTRNYRDSAILVVDVTNESEYHSCSASGPPTRGGGAIWGLGVGTEYKVSTVFDYVITWYQKKK